MKLLLAFLAGALLGTATLLAVGSRYSITVVPGLAGTQDLVKLDRWTGHTWRAETARGDTATWREMPDK